jgi:hypothetical protein
MSIEDDETSLKKYQKLTSDHTNGTLWMDLISICRRYRARYLALARKLGGVRRE